MTGNGKVSEDDGRAADAVDDKGRRKTGSEEYLFYRGIDGIYPLSRMHCGCWLRHNLRVPCPARVDMTLVLKL